uniref:Uncharacterized protein n=1 Tax=Anguilla anguilla TaxID=7936 RepID=A0A0E9T566_ANGAN
MRAFCCVSRLMTCEISSFVEEDKTRDVNPFMSHRIHQGVEASYSQLTSRYSNTSPHPILISHRWLTFTAGLQSIS